MRRRIHQVRPEIAVTRARQRRQVPTQVVPPTKLMKVCKRPFRRATGRPGRCLLPSGAKTQA
jgi:hypothetical protein